MLGNVWEWCDDRQIDERTGESRDPVMRGGSWRSETTRGRLRMG
ncbi:SUMF1/EgtB/PvdO family nonheme iron enzyme [Anatilimnocola aggregata]